MRCAVADETIWSCTYVDGLGTCQEQATHAVLAACVHEHIRTVLVCEVDLSRIHNPNYHKSCRACWDTGHPDVPVPVHFIREKAMS